MWADTQMELTKALDVVLDAKAILGSERSQRYAMVVVDNVIQSFFLEPDAALTTVSSAESVLKSLE